MKSTAEYPYMLSMLDAVIQQGIWLLEVYVHHGISSFCSSCHDQYRNQIIAKDQR